VAVPLFILGSSTDSAHLAAKKGLPYAFASHFAAGQLLNAFKTYHQEFQPSNELKKPYTLAAVNVVVADTDEEAEHIATSLYTMIINLLTGKKEQMQAPFEMTDQLRGITQYGAVQQMLKYAFIGSKETVKKAVKDFMEITQVDEVIAVTHVYSAQARIKSYQLFAEIMRELNEEAL